MNINEEKRSQWQALKGMGFKAYWDYFWDYYKIHVFAGIAFIVFIVMLIHDISNNKPFALNAVLINANNMNDMSEMETIFAEREGINTEENEVYIDGSTTISLTATDQYSIPSMEKIYAQVAANELDVILANKEIFENYSVNGMFDDLRKFFSEEELEALGDRVYYTKSEDSDEEIPYGIELDDNELLHSYDCYALETPYAGVVISSEHQDTAVNFIRYLMENEKE